MDKEIFLIKKSKDKMHFLCKLIIALSKCSQNIYKIRKFPLYIIYLLLCDIINFCSSSKNIKNYITIFIVMLPDFHKLDRR